MRSLRKGIALAIVAGTAVFAFANPASAHDVAASGVVGCTTTGAFQITWTITNDTNSEMTAAVSSAAGGLAASQVVVEPVTGVGTTSNTVTQTVAASETGSTVTLNGSATWADGFPIPPETRPISASVVLDPPCEQPPPPPDPPNPPNRSNRSNSSNSTTPAVGVGGAQAAVAVLAAAAFTG